MKFTLAWMEWTVPTAIFSSTIIAIVIAMTIWQTVSPSLERRGFLPIPTTPGDRLFIGILSSVYIFFRMDRTDPVFTLDIAGNCGVLGFAGDDLGIIRRNMATMVKIIILRNLR